jgi:hypothetical protein
MSSSGETEAEEFIDAVLGNSHYLADTGTFADMARIGPLRRPTSSYSHFRITLMDHLHAHITFV